MNPDENPYQAPQEQGPESDGIFSAAWKFLTSEKTAALRYVAGGIAVVLPFILSGSVGVPMSPAAAVVVKSLGGVLLGAMTGGIAYAFRQYLKGK